MPGALVLALLLLSAAASAPVYTDSQRPHPRTEAPARGSEILKFSHATLDGLSYTAAPRVLALEAESAKDMLDELPSTWGDKSVIALVAVLLLFAALNGAGLFVLVILFKRQRRELRSIELREVRLQHAFLQTEARHMLPSAPLNRPPPAGGSAAGQIFSTESTATLVSPLPASRF